MKKLNWIERTKQNIEGIVFERKVNEQLKQDNKNDLSLLKQLNSELKPFKVKIELQNYEVSPFSASDVGVVPIILKYADLLERDINKAFILSTLRASGFDAAVPYLIAFYKSLLQKYNSPQDETVLLSVCDTIAKIGSDRYIDEYVELLDLPVTPAMGGIIEMLGKVRSDRIESAVFRLIERENRIPEAWIGKPNETDKYWCSQIALIYIVNRRNTKYYSFIERFISPEKLDWIAFAESKYSKRNYAECYKIYKKIAQKGLNYLKK
ncbi:MAG: hypothetical protein IJX76_04230 [Clostridia bacterium]|nr:hypothetical protein [Clostridia bacterium]